MMPSSRPRTTHLIAAVTVVILGFTGCVQDATPSPSAAPAPSASALPNLAANYTLLIHCGVRYATFDGDNWEAVEPIPSISTVVTDSPSLSHNRNEIAGEMVRLSATEAQFTTTEAPVGVVVHFVRMTTPIPGCA
jgi:hypothetical protein